MQEESGELEVLISKTDIQERIAVDMGSGHREIQEENSGLII